MENKMDVSLERLSHLFKIETEIIEIYAELVSDAMEHGENSEKSVELFFKLNGKLSEEEKCIATLELDLNSAQAFLKNIGVIIEEKKLDSIKKYLPIKLNDERFSMLMYRIASIFTRIINSKQDPSICNVLTLNPNSNIDPAVIEKARKLGYDLEKLNQTVDNDIEIIFSNLMEQVIEKKLLEEMTDDEIIRILCCLRFDNMAASKVIEDIELKRKSFGITVSPFEEFQSLADMSRELLSNMKNKRTYEATISSINLLLKDDDASLYNKRKCAHVIVNRIRLRSTASAMELYYLKNLYSSVRTAMSTGLQKNPKIQSFILEDFEAIMVEKEFNELMKQ